MIARLAERAVRRAGRTLLRAGRGAALRASRLWHVEDRLVEPSAVHRLAAVRMDRLGDLVLTLPALDDLAAAFPQAHRIAVVREPLAPLLAGRPSIHRVAGVDRADDVAWLAARLAVLDLDLAIDFSPVDDLRAARALVLAGVPARVGLSGGGREVYFTRTAEPPGRPSPMLELHGRIVQAAGGRPSSRRPRLAVASDAAEEAERMLVRMGAPAGAPRIAVHPGGHYPTQRWPVERFGEASRVLATRTGGCVVILGGPGEDDRMRSLARFVPDAAVVVPPGDLAGLAATLSRCDVLLANNSGPLHVAGAVGLATVSVMGPTDPERFRPVGDRQVVLRRDDLPCSPCTRGRCWPHDCLRGIEPDEVIAAAESLLHDRPIRVVASRAMEGVA